MAYVGPVGPDPMYITCPHCHEKVTTYVTVGPTAKTHLICLVLCLLGCWPCAPCIYCIDECQGKQHRCPRCRNYLGSFND